MQTAMNTHNNPLPADSRSPNSAFFILHSALFMFCLALHAEPLDIWHVRGPGPTTNQLNAVCWGGSGFVAAGNAGTLAASPDGFKWELLTAGIETNLQGVAWGGGVYVVVGDAGTVFTSPDGVKWTARESGTTREPARHHLRDECLCGGWSGSHGIDIDQPSSPFKKSSFLLNISPPYASK